jgi:hypothetical protein
MSGIWGFVARTSHGHLTVVARALTGVSSGDLRLAGMSPVIRAVLSIAVAIAAVVALALSTGTTVDVVGGIAVSVATLVFARAIMDFAAEPGEKRQPRGGPR